MVVDLVQAAFREGFLEEEANWQAVVLMLKGGGEYCIIGPVEVVWKVLELILNFCFAASIAYHDSLHGFRAGRGTGTATLKVKLLQQVSSIREAVLHEIFLHLHNAYNALERSRCLDILEGYGLGPRPSASSVGIGSGFR